MEYGTSSHYVGNSGQSYFEYQNKGKDLGSNLNAELFHDYIKPTDTILDFGCGGGWLLNKIKCAKKFGVEINRAAHSTCQSNGVSVFAEVAQVPARDLDVIITHHCLEHVPFPIEALKQLKTLLKPEGRFVIVVPIDDWRAQKDFTGSDIDHHLHTWTPRLMANTLREAGFQVVDCKILTHAWFPRWESIYGKIPKSVFNALCGLWSALRRRRQMLVVAKGCS